MRLVSPTPMISDSLEYFRDTTSATDNEQTSIDTTSVSTHQPEPIIPESDGFPLFPFLATIFIVVIVAIVLIMAWLKGQKRVRELDVDFTQVFHDAQHMNDAELLYKELSRAIHPDRFPNEPERIMLATERSMEIRAARHSYSELLRIKKICHDEGLL